MPCQMCIKRGKTWNGGDPKCAFEGGQSFNEGNWNCATVNALRDIAEKTRGWSADQSYAFIPLNEREEPETYFEFLYLSWYKSRGRTEQMWLVCYGAPPVPPTEAQCVAILADQRVTA